MRKYEYVVRVGLTVGIPWIVGIIGLVIRDDQTLTCLAQKFCTCGPVDTQCLAHCKTGFSYVLVSLPFLLLALPLVWFQYEQPFHKMSAFRKLYLDADVKPLWEELRRRHGSNVRLNIMVAERLPYWPFAKRFRFEYPLGFTTPENHRDLNLKLTTKQGVAGLAYRTEKPQPWMRGVDPLPTPESWCLKPDQETATAHVCWILSVPMFQEGRQGEPEKAQVRGVINIDATDDATAQALNTSKEIERLSESLLKIGRVASHLW